MKISLLLFAFTLSTSFAQTSNHIEIAVDEDVVLAPESAKIHIQLQSPDEQMEKLFYSEDYYESEYDDYDYYDSEEDWMYEEMLSESPKKITKEMKKEYEDRQKRRIERELEEEKERKLREQRMRDFQPILLSDIQAKLDELGIQYRTVKNTTQEIYFEYEYEDSEYADSSLEVTLTSTEAWAQLENGLKEMPTNLNVQDVKYGSMDEKINQMIPKLTEKAQKQAQAIANSLNRKLGKVIECTNVYPYTPSMKYMSSFTGQLERLSRSSDGSNPFESTKTEMIQYVYKFELL